MFHISKHFNKRGFGLVSLQCVSYPLLIFFLSFLKYFIVGVKFSSHHLRSCKFFVELTILGEGSSSSALNIFYLKFFKQILFGNVQMVIVVALMIRLKMETHFCTYPVFTAIFLVYRSAAKLSLPLYIFFSYCHLFFILLLLFV